MRHKNIYGMVLAGLGAGSVNGIFGAGGGMVLVPLLSALTDLNEDKIFSSSVAIILPLCLVSIAGTALTSDIPLEAALPYLPGSAIGGFLAFKYGRMIPTIWLHRILGILILWGGIRYLC